ncbi:MAG TPA: hypothetical protein VMB77_11195 [Syntrophales bacterium]|nr:hypothetical protein [Syntrophales bacterium]
MTGKRMLLIGVMAAVALFAFHAVSFADTTGKMNVKPGDMIYVCACGEMCDCDTMSMKPGQCSCGKDMIKTKVTKVDDNFIYVEAYKRGLKRMGKYACACGAGCDCNTISQKPGNCSCGKPMKEVKMN